MYIFAHLRTFLCHVPTFLVSFGVTSILLLLSPFHCQFHFTLFLLLLSVSRCHSSEHFAMDLATFQHTLTERGLLSISRRVQQRHADKWISTFVTTDHNAEFEDFVDLAIKVDSIRKIFADAWRCNY